MSTTKNIDTLAIRAFTNSIQSANSSVSLNGLLTKKEQVTIGRRILIAQAILAGKTRYEINNKLRVSPNTFTQVRRWLENELAEYSSAYKLPSQNGHNHASKHTKPFTYSQLKRSYPGHFLLFSLVEELWKIKSK